MFGLVRRMQKLLMPADGVDPAALDGAGDETALDTGGEFFGDGDGSGKAFWPGKESFLIAFSICSAEFEEISQPFALKYFLKIKN